MVFFGVWLMRKRDSFFSSVDEKSLGFLGSVLRVWKFRFLEH